MTDEQQLIVAWLNEAAEDIAAWGDYAIEYFQLKHGLTDDIERFRERARIAKELFEREAADEKG